MSGTEHAPLLQVIAPPEITLHNRAGCNLNRCKNLIEKYGFNKQHSFFSFRIELKPTLNLVGLFFLLLFNV